MGFGQHPHLQKQVGLYFLSLSVKSRDKVQNSIMEKKDAAHFKPNSSIDSFTAVCALHGIVLIHLCLQDCAWTGQWGWTHWDCCVSIVESNQIYFQWLSSYCASAAEGQCQKLLNQPSLQQRASVCGATGLAKRDWWAAAKNSGWHHHCCRWCLESKCTQYHYVFFLIVICK